MNINRSQSNFQHLILTSKHKHYIAFDVVNESHIIMCIVFLYHNHVLLYNLYFVLTYQHIIKQNSCKSASFSLSKSYKIKIYLSLYYFVNFDYVYIHQLKWIIIYLKVNLIVNTK